MKYDGVVLRIEKQLYLFVLDPDTFTMKDGLSITDHECYEDVKGDKLMVVNVVFRDGTLELEDLDLDEFIHGDTYGENDIFIKIHDIMLFSISKEDSIKKITLVELIEKGDLNVIAIDCIEKAKEIEKNV